MSHKNKAGPYQIAAPAGDLEQFKPILKDMERNFQVVKARPYTMSR
jgi:hypothetical protein